MSGILEGESPSCRLDVARYWARPAESTTRKP